jgi:hypothetical protein
MMQVMMVTSWKSHLNGQVATAYIKTVGIYTFYVQEPLTLTKIRGLLMDQ